MRAGCSRRLYHTDAYCKQGLAGMFISTLQGITSIGSDITMRSISHVASADTHFYLLQ